MERLLWGWVAGILLLWVWPALPAPAWALLPLGMAGVVGWLALHRTRRQTLSLVLLGVAGGLGWSVWQARAQMATWIAPACEGRVLSASGVIEGLPVPREDGGWRLVFRPDADDPSCIAPDARWQLSWRADTAVRPGERWAVQVKLKRPHGPANAGGFDAERFAHENRLSAIGSIRQARRLAPADSSIDGLRWQIRQRLLPAFPEQPAAAGTVLALLTGDRSGIPLTAWERYARTGITHLVAISGVHITMVAWLAGLFARRAWVCSARAVAWQPAARMAGLFGWLAAAGYATLAGLEVPAQRTLLMLGVLILMRWLPGEFSGRQALVAALSLVLLMDPLAIHAMGLWLSFAAVALLMAGGLAPGEEGGWRAALRGQWLATWGLMPLTLLLFGRLSWVSLPVNLLAIPWVTFGVVPLAMLGGLLQPLMPEWGIWPWRLAVWLMAVLDGLLQWAAELPGAYSWFSLPARSGLWLMLAVVLCLMPRRLPGRAFLPLPLLAMCWPVPGLQPGQARVTFIDVDQGLAVHVETAAHHLLFDTGPPLGPRADAGSRQILPYLRANRVNALDRLVLSHDDADHTGGAGSVMRELPVREVVGVWPSTLADWPAAQRPRHTACRAGEHWVWDGVRFEWLWPDPARLPEKDNDRSCVLRIRVQGRAILIPGDLEAVGERAVLASRFAGWLRADLLSLGHHGSKTSTTPDWLAAVAPREVVASVGYRNRYRHPAPAVVTRLLAQGVTGWRSDATGSIRYDFLDADWPEPVRWRAAHRHYWQLADDPSMLGALRALP